jgi:hypothetical protein
MRKYVTTTRSAIKKFKYHNSIADSVLSITYGSMETCRFLEINSELRL